MTTHHFAFYVRKMIRFHRYFLLRKYSNGKKKVVAINGCESSSDQPLFPFFCENAIVVTVKMDTVQFDNFLMTYFFSQLDYRTKYIPATTTMEFSRRNGNKGGSELLSHPHSSKNWRGRSRRHIIQTSTRVKRLP